MMKMCKECKRHKPFVKFNYHKSTVDGYHIMCKDCVSVYNKLYREKNKERIKEQNRQYAKDNAEIARQRTKLWIENNKQRKQEADRQRYERLKQEGRLDEYRKNVNKKAVNRKSARWKRDNPGKVAAYLAKRRAAKKRATPKWAELDQIKLLYIEAARITKETGVKHQVDHIIALECKEACGLHCLANLRIVTAEENNKKKCKLDETLL